MKIFSFARKTHSKKNVPASDDARSIQKMVVADCKKEFSDYWMAALLKYKIPKGFA